MKRLRKGSVAPGWWGLWRVGVLAGVLVGTPVACRDRPDSERRDSGRGRPSVAERVRSAAVPRYPVLGPADAPVTLALFSHPADTMRLHYALRMREKFPRAVRVIWLYNVWPDQLQEAKLALAAHRQGLFWEARRLLAARDRQKAGRCEAEPSALPVSRRVDGPPARIPAPLDREAWLALLHQLPLDMRRLDSDLADRQLEQEIVRQWRVARALGLVRPRRWQGADFLLVNGVRLLPSRPGFTPAKQALHKLERMVEREIARAAKYRELSGAQRERALARANRAARYIELVIDGASPPRAAGVAIDRETLKKARRGLVASAVRRSSELLADRVALRVRGLDGGGLSRFGPELADAPRRAGRAGARPKSAAAKPSLARRVLAFAAARDVPPGFDRWRRMVVISAISTVEPQLRRALVAARSAGFSVRFIVWAVPPKRLRYALHAITGIWPTVADRDGLAETIHRELARRRTIVPASHRTSPQDR